MDPSLDHHSNPKTPTKTRLNSLQQPNTDASTPSRRITRRTAANNAGNPSSSVRQVNDTILNSYSSPLESVEIRDEPQKIMNREELLKCLCDGFPGRQTQIKELISLVGGPRDFMIPLLVYGGPSTGKTSVVLDIFKRLNRPFAYASCRSCFSPRLLFESILNQLISHRRTKANNYSSAKRCEKIADFVVYLKEACIQAIEKKYEKKLVGGSIESRKDGEPGFTGSPPRDSQKIPDKGLKESVFKGSPHEDTQISPEKGFQESGFKGSPRKNTQKSPEKGLKGSSKKNTGRGLQASGCDDPSQKDKGKRDNDSLSKEVRRLDFPEVVYLIFDNIELLHEWNNGFNLISALFKLSDLTRMPNLGLIFISNITPDSFYSHTGALEPLTVYFRDYTDDELYQILIKGQPNTELYASFLNAILKPFSRACRRVTELSTALEPLFQKYCEPISKEAVVPDENGKRRLFSYLEPHIAPALNQIFNVPTSGDKVRRKIMTRRQGFDEIHEDLDFHLSVCGKYLLISAFIASRNPATLDATLFDSSGGLDNRKRRKKSVKSTERKEHEEQEKFLKGPGSFPLERLLAIFQCITAVADEELENLQSDNISAADENGLGPMADALMQLSTLCNINLLYKGTSCPLEGAARYRCNIDQELAMKIACSVKFPLSKYLYR